MNPITAVLAVFFGALGVALGNFVNLYLGVVCLAIALVIWLALARSSPAAVERLPSAA